MSFWCISNKTLLSKSLSKTESYLVFVESRES